VLHYLYHAAPICWSEDTTGLRGEELKDAHQYEYIIVEHKDRLTRFGYHLIINNVNNIYVVNEVDNEDHGLMEDLVAIITSFCARLYGQRRSKRKTEKLIAELKNEQDS
jgi:putative resolvase